jgi:hypothetical protein
MHRSGTSAVTRAVNVLGVPVGLGLKPPSKRNPRGFWEVVDMTRFNEELLHVLGGSYAAPPLLQPGWERRDELAALRDRGAAVFEQSHPYPQWVWKDPRNCTLLPFWIAALRSEPVLVLVHRNPLEVWSSLAQQGRFISKAYSLALWERSMRDALSNISGHPVRVVRYEDLVADPVTWCEGMRRFLQRHSVRADSPNAQRELAGFVDPGLRHTRRSTEEALEDPDLSPEQRRLVEALEARLGDHDEFAPPDLPPEPTWIETVLLERRLGDLRLQEALEPSQAQVRALEERTRRAATSARAERARAHALERRLAGVERELELARAQRAAMRASWSWRLTAPLRAAGRWALQSGRGSPGGRRG